jgi:hypothetical protein
VARLTAPLTDQEVPASLSRDVEVAAAVAAEAAARSAALDALSTSVAGKVSKADNLSDLVDAEEARGNLGLGDAATQDAADLPVSTAQGVADAYLSKRIGTGKSLASLRWDDFDRADGLLSASPTLPSGQTWQLGVAGGTAVVDDIRIVDKSLRNTSAVGGATYMWTTGLTDPEEIAVEFAYLPGTTILTAVALCASKKTGASPVGASGVATNSVHATFGPSTWGVGLFVNGATLVTLGNGGYANTPRTPSNTVIDDGVTRYRAFMRKIGPDKLLVGLPDGTERIYTDPRISRWWGPTVLIEHYVPGASLATDKQPIITGYYVGGASPRPLAQKVPSGVAGLPGGTVLTAVPIATPANFTCAVPFVVVEPITVSKANWEVTTAGSAGTMMRVAIARADESLQPTELVWASAEVAVDALGAASVSGLTVSLDPGRYLLLWRVANIVSFRQISWASPGISGVVPALGATPFARHLTVGEAYGAFAADPTNWATISTSSSPGWFSPIVLEWS